MDVSTDPRHSHLIGDCLIHIFTFLTEEDLISASCVCKVRSVQLAEVANAQQERAYYNSPNVSDYNGVFLGLA